MLTYQQLCNAMKGWATELSRFPAKGQLTPKQVFRKQMLERNYHNAFVHAIGLVLEKSGVDYAVTHFTEMLPEKERGSAVSAIVGLIRSNARMFGVNYNLPEDATRDSAEQNIALIKAVRAATADPSKLDDGITRMIANKIAQNCEGFKNPEKFDEMMASFRQIFGAATDEITFNEEEFLPASEMGEKADTHPFEEQINALIAENQGNDETVAALEDANRILIQGIKEFVKQTGDAAEKMGEASDVAKVNAINQFANEDPEYAKYPHNPTKRHVEIDGTKITPEQRSELTEHLLGTQLNYSQEEKDRIKAIVAKLRDNGLFTPETFKGESGSKIYGMNSLIRARNEVEKAVNGKDIPGIIAATKKYRDLEKVYDELIEECKACNTSDSIVSNIASSREDVIPWKYRLDVVGVSRLNGAWQFLGLCNAAGVSPEEVIDDPIVGARKIIRSAMTDHSGLNRCMKEGDLAEVINESVFIKIKEGNLGAAIDRDLSLQDAFERGIEGLSMLFPDGPEKVKLQTAQMLFQSVYTSELVGEMQGTATDYLHTDTQAKIANMMLVESEDRNYLELNPNPGPAAVDPKTAKPRVPFDRDRYVRSGKTTPAAVVFRAAKTVSDLTKKHPQCKFLKQTVCAAKDNLTLVPPEKRSETMNYLCGLVEQNRFGKIKATDLLNLQAEDRFARATMHGIGADSIEETIRSISDIQKKYDNRNFFAKLFYSSLGRQERMIEAMKAKVVASGAVSREALENALKLDTPNKQEQFLAAMEQIRAAAPQNREQPEQEQVVRPPEQMNVAEANNEQPQVIPERTSVLENQPQLGQNQPVNEQTEVKNL